MKNKIFQSRDLCLRALGTNSLCTKNVRRNGEKMKVVIVVGIVIVLVAVFVIAEYNSLVKARQRVRNAGSQIDVQIQRRFDLVESMQDMVKEYAKHESDIFEDTAKLRTQWGSVHMPDDKMVIKEETDKLLHNLVAVVENYPELKANQNYLMLQETLKESEQKTALARQIYNDSVTIYNTKIESFPSNLFARLFHFLPEALFEARLQQGRK